MEFEWDPEKAERNLAKHGVGFEIAREFDWANSVTLPDSRFDYGERRFIAYGRSSNGAGYVIAFTFRGESQRIISVRPFGRKESRLYGK
jgi:uncharacterized DUF497 family protein